MRSQNRTLYGIRENFRQLRFMPTFRMLLLGHGSRIVALGSGHLEVLRCWSSREREEATKLNVVNRHDEVHVLLQLPQLPTLMETKSSRNPSPGSVSLTRIHTTLDDDVRMVRPLSSDRSVGTKGHIVESQCESSYGQGLTKSLAPW